MDVVVERCCGLDLHKKLVVACRIVPGPQGAPVKEVRSFGTLTDDLLALGDWLAEAGVTHVAMESTGVYWKPVWNLLEDRFTLLLCNAQHIKAVPGRKTDVQDSVWIAELLRHGLLHASFVPARPQRELRELTRYRTTLVRERAAESARLQKTLEGANIKLASVATDILGTSGRAMLDGLVAGTEDAAALARLARGKLRDKVPTLERALAGRIGAHQRFVLSQQLAPLDHLTLLIEEVGAEITRRLLSGPTDQPPPDPTAEHVEAAEPDEDAGDPVEAPTRPITAERALVRLQEIPGVGQRTAELLVAEIGLDMRRFPTAAHLASWAGMCPGHHESAGKRTSGKTRRGSPWLRSALVEAARAAARSKDTYLGAQYRRLAARRGGKRAAVAVGHSILVAAYHLLDHDCPYVDQGSMFFDRRDQDRTQRRLVSRLEALGYAVQLERTIPRQQTAA